MKHILLLPLAVSLAAAPALAVTLTPTSYSNNTSPYAYVDDTGTQLTDGLFNAVVPGSNLATPDAYNWVGWSNINPSITFDFGQVVTVMNLSLSTVRWEAAGVYLPDKVNINLESFTVTGLYPNLDKAVLSFNGSWTGSTLTIELERNAEWTFLDEVTFEGRLGAPTQTPTPAPEAGATMLYLIAAGCIALTGKILRTRWSGAVHRPAS